MIIPAVPIALEDDVTTSVEFPNAVVLARYGRVPQVARFAVHGEVPERGAAIVVQSDRGEEVATVLQTIPSVSVNAESPGITGDVLRIAAADDIENAEDGAVAAERSFPEWLDRAARWNLQLELIDIERTLDGRLILYVLNDRGAETTRLALLAAAGGFGTVHVQPVAADGIVQSTGGGCGSGGCGSGGCASH